MRSEKELRKIVHWSMINVIFAGIGYLIGIALFILLFCIAAFGILVLLGNLLVKCVGA